MIKRISSNGGDDTSASCVVAGGFIFLSYHSGGLESNDVAFQMEASFKKLGATLELAGASFDDIVQINLYLKNIEDFSVVKNVFYQYFKEDGFPARMTTTTDFISPSCLCMLDAVAFKKELYR